MRFLFVPEARSQLRAIERPAALEILEALVGETAAGDVVVSKSEPLDILPIDQILVPPSEPRRNLAAPIR